MEGRGGDTRDPSLPMGQRGLRWWERGERCRVSPLVGYFVGRIHERTSLWSPLVPPPTYVKGGDNSGRGWCWGRWVRRRRGGHVRRPSSSRDGCGAGLWDGVGGRARADWREGSGGYTRCSRRYGGRDRGFRVRDRAWSYRRESSGGDTRCCRREWGRNQGVRVRGRVRVRDCVRDRGMRVRFG
jgi:hypothetical protein